MNGSRVVLDTNIIISDITGENPSLYYILEKHDAVISVITQIELLGYHNLTDEEEQLIRDLLEHIEIVSLDDKIAETAISIRKSYNIKTPDSIIIATAIHENLPLVTRDKKLHTVQEVLVVSS